ncbi:MAG: hydrogenase iron-sulfur subunit [Deltaproteobacteria bacterium]|nr:hydrogenase iron-sulfur subunit [Deltaproteobacteria bacterium]
MDNVGTFVCTGCEIADLIDVEALEDAAKEEGSKQYITHPCLCGPEGLAEINKAIDGGVNGLCIAACSHRMKIKEFSFDVTKLAVERVCFREQVAWSQAKPEDDEAKENIQMLAEDLLRMGLARVTRKELPKVLEEEIDSTVLVVGGGMTGLQAAQASSAMGHPVVILESTDKLGGYLGDVKDLVPEHPPYNTVVSNNIGQVISAVEADSNIRVITGGKTKVIDGQPGQFQVELEGGESFKVGSIVQATGASPYDASKLDHLGYGKSPNVITTRDIELMVKDGKLACPSGGQQPKRIVFVQCAGSRDENHLAYCSGECCGTTLKLVAGIHRDFPEVECAVVYRDMRTPGQLEHFYLGVQEQSGGMFTRGDVDKVEASGDQLSVHVKDSLLGDDVSIDADLVVLATGMVPNSADGEQIRELQDAYGRIEKNESETQVADAKKLVEELKEYEGTEILNLNYRQGPDMPVLRYGFPDSHYICFPYETRRTGIYAAGAVHAPMDVSQAIEDGYGAAMKAVQCIESLKKGEAVHPRAGDIAIADFFLQRCTQCKRCTEECPFGTINEDEKGTPEYNALRCRRCGICLGACPERIISFPDYSVDQVASMIKSFEVPDEDEEKPRMIAFLCENDALPALDEAAARKLKWNPWIRVIPVRCLGAVNTVWIADSLSSGIDGILLIGCKKGDDYQCHYIKGSELAATRMGNVQETLERLTLESERVQVHELERDEFDRIPEIFEAFAETIEEVGPNPYKGF